MTVTLGDTEAERIAAMLEALSALQPDEVPGQYDDGMKADATMYADELRERQGRDVDELTRHFTFVYRGPGGPPEILLDARVPPDTRKEDLLAAAKEKFRREGYDPDKYADQIHRRVDGWYNEGRKQA